MRDLVLLILGWLLGLLGPGIAERVRRVYHRKDLTRTLVTELRELKLNLGLAVWKLRSHLGTIDAGLVTWLRPIVDSYKGVEEDPDTFSTVRKFLAHPPDQAAGAAARGAEARRVVGQSPRLTPFAFPYLVTNTAALSVLPVDLQTRLWQIHNQLQICNDHAAQAASYMDRTFDSSLTSENRDLIEENISSTLGRVADRAQRIADAVGRLLSRYGDA